MCFHLAEAHGFKTALLTPEDPADRLKNDMMRFALRRSKFPAQAEQQAARDWVNEHFFISHPPEDEPISLGMVMHEMESAALHHDCQVFVIDPWNEVEHDYSRGETETQYIERALRAFKRKMRRLQMILIIAAHPTKVREGKDSAENQFGQVNLYSISGSANWKNKADHGVIIRRANEKSRIVEVCVEKSKDHEVLGVPGSVWMEFDRAQADYKPIPKPEGKAP
jgi:twinkle protein